MPDSPTSNGPGHWVDIDFGDGVQGMMSYILEAIPYHQGKING